MSGLYQLINGFTLVIMHVVGHVVPRHRAVLNWLGLVSDQIPLKSLVKLGRESGVCIRATSLVMKQHRTMNLAFQLVHLGIKTFWVTTAPRPIAFHLGYEVSCAMIVEHQKLRDLRAV
jgi:hypothetical protein